MKLRDALERVARHERFASSDAEAMMDSILDGAATPAQVGALLMGLRVRGETPDEILGFARALRRHALEVPGVSGPLLDTCGTGGDGQHTVNVSTVAALVASAHSVRVAKHGNRAVGSRCGSADLLAATGIRIDVPPAEIAHWLREARFAFLLAPAYHPALKAAAEVRREIGTRTVMNLLGPLANPAPVTHQLLGLFDRAWIEPIASLLPKLGIVRALVVHSHDGLDEISPCAATWAVHLDHGATRELELTPEEAGLERHPRGALRGGDAADNVRLVTAALDGARGACRDAILLNAGAALWLWGSAANWRDGVGLAADIIDSGRARTHVIALRELSARKLP